MKKLIITILLVLPLTIMAQSRGDRLVGTYGFKQNKSLNDSITNQVNRQLAHNRLSKIPLIEDDRVVKSKELTKKHCTNNKCTFKQVLKAVFLGGKFPWETKEQYKLRKQVESMPAGQPFK